MDTAQQEATARARELQRSWYGEPLGALFRRLIDDLGLNQARLAAVLGLSAPMLAPAVPPVPSPPVQHAAPHAPVRRMLPGPSPKVAAGVVLAALVCFAVGIWALTQV
ncbi:hypothetical protein SCALM49S_04514 [Streptomyces californicus]